MIFLLDSRIFATFIWWMVWDGQSPKTSFKTSALVLSNTLTYYINPSITPTLWTEDFLTNLSGINAPNFLKNLCYHCIKHVWVCIKIKATHKRQIHFHIFSLFRDWVKFSKTNARQLGDGARTFLIKIILNRCIWWVLNIDHH